MATQKRYYPGLESQEGFQEEAATLRRPEGCQVKHGGAAGGVEALRWFQWKKASAKARGEGELGILK